jgi:hypothetical protein
MLLMPAWQQAHEEIELSFNITLLQRSVRFLHRTEYTNKALPTSIMLPLANLQQRCGQAEL